MIWKTVLLEPLISSLLEFKFRGSSLLNLGIEERALGRHLESVSLYSIHFYFDGFPTSTSTSHVGILSLICLLLFLLLLDFLITCCDF